MYWNQRRVGAIAAAIAILILSTAGRGQAATLSVDFDERVTPPSPTFPGFSSFLMDPTPAVQTGDTTRAFGPLNVTVQNVGPTTTGYDDRLRGTPANVGLFTQSDLLRDFIFSRQLANLGLNLRVTGLVPFGIYDGSIWSFDSGSTGVRVSDWFANGATIRNNYTFGGQIPPVTNEDYRISFSVMASETGEVTLKGRRDVLSVNAAVPPLSDFGVFVNALELEDTGSALLVTDPVLSVDFGSGATTLPGFDSMSLAANGSTFGGKTVTLSPIGVTLEERNRAAPLNNGPFTHEALLQDFIFALTGAPDTTGMEVRVDGLTPGQQYLATLWSYDASSTGARGSNWLGDGGPIAYQFAGEAGPRSNEDYRFRLLATADASGSLFVYGLKSLDGIDNHAVFLNALELRAVIPEPSTFALALGVFVALLLKVRSSRRSQR
jgi:hypothetical protein